MDAMSTAEDASERSKDGVEAPSRRESAQLILDGAGGRVPCSRDATRPTRNKCCHGLEVDMNEERVQSIHSERVPGTVRRP